MNLWSPKRSCRKLRAARRSASTSVPAFADSIRCIVSRTDCERSDGPHSTDQLIHSPFPIGMEPTAEPDVVQVPLGVDPDSGAGEAAVTDGPITQSLAAIAGVAGAVIPTIGPGSTWDFAGSEHQFPSRFTEDPRAVQFPFSQDHLRVE